jgi:BirA family transcriptional regulator, biotin operon repressor / biotin---[acetyl-CoA-carboxylase] ligase
MTSPAPVPFDVNAFLTMLRRSGCSLGEPFHYFTTTTSTSDEAKQLALHNAPHGTTCLAEFQTNGRGRQGKTWQAQPNAHLLVSVVLRGANLVNNAAVTLAVGVAIHRALQPLVGKHPLRIKWPNDIEVDGNKLAGILTETHLSAGASATIVGFGVNVLEPSVADHSLKARALRTLGCEVGRERLLLSLLSTVEAALADFERSGLTTFVPYLNQYDALWGATVHVDGIEGRALGVAADGGLLLDTGSERVTVGSGTVERR